MSIKNTYFNCTNSATSCSDSGVFSSGKRYVKSYDIGQEKYVANETDSNAYTLDSNCNKLANYYCDNTGTENSIEPQTLIVDGYLDVDDDSAQRINSAIGLQDLYDINYGSSFWNKAKTTLANMGLSAATTLMCSGAIKDLYDLVSCVSEMFGVDITAKILGISDTNNFDDSVSDTKLTSWKDDYYKCLHPELYAATTYAGISDLAGIVGSIYVGALGKSNDRSTSSQTFWENLSSSTLNSLGITRMLCAWAGCDDEWKFTSSEIVDLMTITYNNLYSNRCFNVHSKCTNNALCSTYISCTGTRPQFTPNTNASTVCSQWKNMGTDVAQCYSKSDKAICSCYDGICIKTSNAFNGVASYRESNECEYTSTLLTSILAGRLKKEVGFIHLKPYSYNYYGQGNNFACGCIIDIPFEFNANINEQSAQAKYSTLELLNQNIAYRSYINSDAPGVTLETCYLALISDEDAVDDSKLIEYAKREKNTNLWQFKWSPQMLRRVEMAYRSLVVSDKTTCGKSISNPPPIIEIYLGDSGVNTVQEAFAYNFFGTSNSDKYLLGSYTESGACDFAMKQYVVTGVQISPFSEDYNTQYDICNGYSYCNDNGTIKIDNYNTGHPVKRVGFKVSINLNETTKYFLDVIPDFKYYFDYWNCLGTCNTNATDANGNSYTQSEYISTCLSSSELDVLSANCTATYDTLINAENLLTEFCKGFASYVGAFNNNEYQAGDSYLKDAICTYTSYKSAYSSACNDDFYDVEDETAFSCGTAIAKSLKCLFQASYCLYKCDFETRYCDYLNLSKFTACSALSEKLTNTCAYLSSSKFEASCVFKELRELSEKVAEIIESGLMYKAYDDSGYSSFANAEKAFKAIAAIDYDLASSVTYDEYVYYGCNPGVKKEILFRISCSCINTLYSYLDIASQTVAYLLGNACDISESGEILTTDSAENYFTCSLYYNTATTNAYCNCVYNIEPFGACLYKALMCDYETLVEDETAAECAYAEAEEAYSEYLGD